MSNTQNRNGTGLIQWISTEWAKSNRISSSTSHSVNQWAGEQ